jgi:hypothetical protein
MKLLLNASCSTTALLIVLLVLGCGSSTTAQAGDKSALRIGWVRFGGMEHRTGSAEGYLLVCSATDEFSDGDLIFNAHSSYSIHTTDGKLFKNVENHMSRSDENSRARELAGWVLHRSSKRDQQTTDTSAFAW